MRTSRALLGIVAGIAAGAIIGVLMAPDTGENTRKKIVSKSNSTVDDLKSKFNSLVDGFAAHKEEMKDMLMPKTNKVDIGRKVNT